MSSESVAVAAQAEAAERCADDMVLSRGAGQSSLTLLLGLGLELRLSVFEYFASRTGRYAL
ncbi:MAG TPA: hypothetical protein VKR21_18650 [Solirubrobacteraceae bacterium]|nr:hypothetical protein [Solirubrobacteraceae bacterium]